MTNEETTEEVKPVEVVKRKSTKYSNMNFCGNVKIKEVLEGDDGFIYITQKDKDWEFKLAQSLADTMLSEKADEGAGNSIMDLKHATIAQALKIIMKNDYNFKISQATKVTQLIRSIYNNDDSTEKSVELCELLKTAYEVDQKEIESIMQKVETSIMNDLGLATRMIWGKSRYDLDLNDIAGVINKGSELVGKVQEEIDEENRQQILNNLER